MADRTGYPLGQHVLPVPAGYLDKEYYEDEFRQRVRRLMPTWQALNITRVRGSFLAELERLERDRAA